MYEAVGGCAIVRLYHWAGGSPWTQNPTLGPPEHHPTKVNPCFRQIHSVSGPVGRHFGQQTGQLPPTCCSLIPVPMNSGRDADQDLPDDSADDVTDDSDSESGQAEGVDSDSGPLQRSQEAIDEGRDAAREALKETLPDDEDS
jgi:hypothetical protein